VLFVNARRCFWLLKSVVETSRLAFHFRALPASCKLQLWRRGGEASTAATIAHESIVVARVMSSDQMLTLCASFVRTSSLLCEVWCCCFGGVSGLGWLMTMLL
jgi:hypothetical protein